MKRLSLLAAFVTTLFCTTQLSMAQEHKDKKEKHEIHVKATIIEDGIEKSIDTIFYELKHDGEIMELLSKKGFNDSIMSKHMIWVSDDDEHHKGKHKMMKTFCFSGDSTIDIDFDTDVKVLRKLKFSDTDSLDFEDITIEMIHDGDHKIHRLPKHAKGKKVIVINDSDDVTISDEGDYKIIKIKKTGDDNDNVWIEKVSDSDRDVVVEVEVKDEDAKAIKKKRVKRKKNKSKTE